MALLRIARLLLLAFSFLQILILKCLIKLTLALLERAISAVTRLQTLVESMTLSDDYQHGWIRMSSGAQGTLRWTVQAPPAELIQDEGHLPGNNALDGSRMADSTQDSGFYGGDDDDDMSIDDEVHAIPGENRGFAWWSPPERLDSRQVAQNLSETEAAPEYEGMPDLDVDDQALDLSPEATSGEVEEIEESSEKCPICFHDLATAERVKLLCEHTLCKYCVVQCVKTGLSGPKNFPPKCLVSFDCQELLDVEALKEILPADLTRRYHAVYNDWSQKYRVNCAEVGCHAQIPDKNFINSGIFGKCTRCENSTCRLCQRSRSEHSSEHACPEPLPVEKLLETMKGEDVQRCPSCRHLILRPEGCRHMT
ncbi:MAG: hypothetical protein Q9227_005635 [Pyrenula ochraceoflavens]